MDNRPNIDEEIGRTLAIIENLERAQPSPWFYTRLKARLGPAPPLSLRVAPWQWALFVLLLTANGFTLFTARSGKASTSSDSALIQAIRAEYGFEDYASDWLNLTPRQ